MALTESRRKANEKYLKENYQRLAVSYPKEFIAEIKTAASAKNESVANYVKVALMRRMAAESMAGSEENSPQGRM